ncbi:unnamed protein product [Ectocarpus sp. CCAP 1310/34]|nr:unnamed protein product [Ectocarpus sp. CCAP 1310/34]
MRAYACLAALAATKVAAHPLCYFDDRPTDYDQVLTFCDNSIAMSGACCTDEEEGQVEANFDAAFAEGVVPSSECAALYKEAPTRTVLRRLSLSRAVCLEDEVRLSAVGLVRF